MQDLVKMTVKQKSAEWISGKKNKFNASRSLNVAKEKARNKVIYRIPNGTYFWRK